MKNILICITAVLLFTSFASAESVKIPLMQGNSAMQVDIGYGGVDYTTITFSAANTVVADGEALVYGVGFSSGNCADYVLLNDTGTLSVAGSTVTTVYNSLGSTTSVLNASGGLCAGTVWFAYPIRFKQGVRAKVSTNAYNQVTIYSWKRR